MKKLLILSLILLSGCKLDDLSDNLVYKNWVLVQFESDTLTNGKVCVGIGSTFDSSVLKAQIEKEIHDSITTMNFSIYNTKKECLMRKDRL